MTTRQLSTILCTVPLMCLAVSGCNTEPQDPEVLAIREHYVSATEPTGAVTLSELAQRLDGKTEDSSSNMAEDVAAGVEAAAEESAPDETAGVAVEEAAVVVGRVYAGDLEPWDPGKASFLLAELPEQGHGEGHDADNCPFCKRKAAQAPTAIVQFLDDRGQVLAYDARRLFGLKKHDVVIVRGRASRGELNTLILTADAIHVHGK